MLKKHARLVRRMLQACLSVRAVSVFIVLLFIFVVFNSLTISRPVFFFIKDSEFNISLDRNIWWIKETWHHNEYSGGYIQIQNGVLRLFYNETTGDYYGNSGVVQGRHTDGRRAQNLWVGESPTEGGFSQYITLPKNVPKGKFWLKVRFRIVRMGFNVYPSILHPDYSRVNLGITLMCAINDKPFNLDAQTLWLDIYFAGYCLNETDIWVIPKNERYVAYDVYTDPPNIHDNDIHAGYFVHEVYPKDFKKWTTIDIDLGDYISRTLHLIDRTDIKTIRVYGFILFVEALGAYSEVEYDYIKTYVR